MKNQPRITIIGIGLIGGSLARAFRRFVPEAELIGVDQPDVLEFAMREKLIDHAFAPEDLAKACKNAGFIFIATPISVALKLLPELSKVCGAKSIVSDMCSIKGEILEKAKTHFADSAAYFIGGHPMAGAEKPGPGSSDPYLFENAIYVLSPDSLAPEPAVQKLAGLLQKIGSHILLLDADIHDEIAAGVSHLPQMLAVTLMLFIAEKNQENGMHLKMAAGGFRDMTRIASSPFHIWRDICAGNRKKIVAEIDGFIEALQRTRAQVENDHLEESFAQSARARLSIPKDTRGFLQRNYDLSVDVEDKSGVIATIANVLAEANINIKDIEVLKVREDEGGTLRLAFDSERAREVAKSILQKRGHRCRNK